MLVLSRKRRESVVVGAAAEGKFVCKVTVLEIQGARVRLGFEVDGHVPVHRLELWERIHAAGGEAELRADAGTRPPLS